MGLIVKVQVSGSALSYTNNHPSRLFLSGSFFSAGADPGEKAWEARLPSRPIHLHTCSSAIIPLPPIN